MSILRERLARLEAENKELRAMIKFKAGRKPGQTDVVGIGITAKNVEQLKLGNPIYIMAADLSLPFDITIFYGETEEKIAADLAKHHMIGPETIVHEERKKTRQ